MARDSGGRDAGLDEGLVRALFDQHGQAVLAYATRLGGDRAAGEDVTQETFIRLWRHSEVVVVNGPDYVRGWLLKVAKHIVIDRFRAQQARPREVPEDPARPPVERDHAEGVIDMISLLDGLRKLSPDHRAVLEQRYIRSRSVRETAQVLGIPENTVKTRTAHGLVALRKVMNGPESRSPEERSA